MNYQQALKEANRVGVSKAEGMPLLASFCSLAQHQAGAVNCEMVYKGAVAKGITANQYRKLEPTEIEDLMWVGMEQ